MKEVEVNLVKIPSVDEDNDGNRNESFNWKGKAVINLPKYKERLKIIRDMGIQVNMNQEQGAEVDFTQEGGAFVTAEKMADLAEKHIISLDAEHLPTKQKFKEVEDLEYSSEGVELLNALASMVVNGVSLGNASGRR